MNKFSTMRIDLIPEISDIPLSERPKPSFVTSRQKKAGDTTDAAAAQEQRGYSELFQNVYDAGIITDLRGRVRDVNRRAVDAFGYSDDDLKKLTIEDLIAGANDELIKTLYENLQHECFTLMQAYCFRDDGTAFPAEIAVSRLRLPTPHLSFFIRDITLRRQADEMLRTEHNALQNASDAIIVIDMQAKIEYANPATARIWGYSTPSELVGNSLGTLLANPDDGDEVVSSLTGEHFMSSGVVVAKRANGEAFRSSVNAACNRDSDGNIVGAVLSFYDLTVRDRVEIAERDAERFRATLKRLDDFRNSLECNFGDIRAELKHLADANAEAAKAKLDEVHAICEGADAILSDMHELIATTLSPMKSQHLSAD